MKEEDIRPKKIFDEYLRLAKIDSENFFRGQISENIDCPACNNEGINAFEKNSFSYKYCENCETIYVSPRPNYESFEKYYSDAPSTKFWASSFYSQTASARREKLWKPKVKIIQSLVKKLNIENPNFIDIGGGYGIFAEEIKRLVGLDVLIIEPSIHLAKEARKRGLQVLNKFLENVSKDEIPDGRNIFVSFELFEHLHNPGVFLDQVYELMRDGDIFIFTTLSGTGVDILGLWSDSKSIHPPHHLNFFNPISIKLLIEKSNLNLLDLTTPGKLDFDILKNNADLIKDRFLKSLIRNSDEKELEIWQDFISKSGYSSHMLVCCQK